MSKILQPPMVKFPIITKICLFPTDELLAKEVYVPLTEPIVPLDQQKLAFNAKFDESDTEYWQNNAQSYLKDVLTDPQKEMKLRKAKNIILFMGDGMSLTTIAATRMYLGNEKNSLSFEKFAHFGLSKVRSQFKPLSKLI